MASIPTNHKPASPSLPQYGFGADVDFGTLIKTNHFLFRVYTPKGSSPLPNDTEPYFLASKFNEKYNLSPKVISKGLLCLDDCTGTYDDVARHMDWTTRSSSPYISTSFSFIWSIWEALRRYHRGVKKDVEIAVIDSSAVVNRAITAVQLLRNSLPSERRSDHWKWYRFAQESQSVLVYEYIPAYAVLASVPLIPLLEKLPSYFLRPEIPNTIKGNALSIIGWDYTERKRSYRQFCQDMSTRFLQLPSEARLKDATAGSVRLAMSFLHPWFQRCATEDLQHATAKLCALAFSIAVWPGHWWAQEHSELWDLIWTMALSLAQEVRARQRSNESPEVTQVVAELEDAVNIYEAEVITGVVKKPAKQLVPLVIPPALRLAPMPVCPSPSQLAPPSSLSSRLPSPTPITPPTSPIHSSIPIFPPDARSSSAQSSPVMTPVLTPLLLDVDLPNSPPSPTTDNTSSPIELQSLNEAEAEAKTELPELLVEPPSLRETEILMEPSPKLTPVEPPTQNQLPPTEKSSIEPCLPADIPSPVHISPTVHKELSAISEETLDEREDAHWKVPSVAETASCFVTGFLIGAFITLCLFSTQRRTLLTHLT